MAHLLLGLAAVPAAGAVVLAMLPRAQVRLAGFVTSATSCFALALALPLWFSFQPRGAQWQFAGQVDFGGWRWLTAVDGFAVALVLATVFAAAIAALLLAREPPPRARTWGMTMLVMEAGVLGALVSLELRQMFVFWQLAMLALVAMTALSGSRRVVVAAIAVLVVSAASMLSGLLVLGEHYASLASVASFDVRQFHTMPVGRPVQMQAFVLLAIACLTPFVLLALQGWSAARWDGEPAAGLLASMPIAALAFFGFLRVVLPVIPQATRAFATAMAVAGLVFAAFAVLAAWKSRASLAVYWIGLAQALLAMVGVFAATPGALTAATIQLLAAGPLVAAVMPIAAGRSARDTGQWRGADAVTLVVAASSLAGLGSGRMLLSAPAPLGRTAGYAALAIGAGMALVLGWIAVRLSSAAKDAGGTSVRDVAIAAPSAVLLLAMFIHPAPLAARLETSVARVIVRVSPEYASEVSDCLNQPAPPPPTDSGLPGGAMLAAPCADASSPADPAVKR